MFDRKLAYSFFLSFVLFPPPGSSFPLRRQCSFAFANTQWKKSVSVGWQFKFVLLDLSITAIFYISRLLSLIMVWILILATGIWVLANISGNNHLHFVFCELTLHILWLFFSLCSFLLEISKSGNQVFKQFQKHFYCVFKL